MKITLAKFNDLNPRKDVKSMHWIRIEVALPRAKKLHGLPATLKWIWVALCCVAGEEANDGTINCELPWLADQIKEPESVVQEALNVFVIKGLVTIEDDGPTPLTYGSDRTRTDPYGSDRETPSNPEEPERTRTDPCSTRRDVTRRDETVRDETLSPDDLAIAADWLQLAHEEMPWLIEKPQAAYTVQRYASAIAKVRRSTGITPDGMAALLAFIRDDPFWRKNALSPAGLLKKSSRNDQRKIDNILVRMRSGADQRVDALREWAAEQAAKEAADGESA